MTTTRDQHKGDLLQFLRTIQKAGLPVESLGDRDRLVASGLIDSLALLQIVTYLEQTYRIDFADRGIDPGDLRSVQSILELIARESST